MATMKYPGVSNSTSNMAVSGNASHPDSEVDSLLMNQCWSQNSGNNLQAEFMDPHKLMLDTPIGNLGSDKLLLENSISQDSDCATKATMDAIDSLLLNSQPLTTNLAELKPLPPFTGYTGHLSINGIQGHHYHAIAQRLPEENNNTYNSYSNEQNIVSSSTCINVSADSAGDSKQLYSGVDEVTGVKVEYTDCVNPDSVSSAKMYDSVDSVAHVKTELAEYDISSIEDIAAIIGSAIADTTVPSSNLEEDAAASRDSWIDLDAWIDGACVDNSSQKSLIITQEGLSEFILPNSPHQGEFSKSQSNATIEYSTKLGQTQHQSSTLQSLLTHGYMPLLQNRLQNGPPIKQEASSSTSYGVELITTSSPPANVVSTTDNIMLNGRYIQQHYSVMGGISDDRIRSPDLLGQNYPHTTTTTPSVPKKSRSRSQKKQQAATSSTVFQAEQNLGLLGKEKPVHRCNVCNRGFLNKSNIKVHLRTHTGEKPFRCETCAKAFRQKAHLIKHQQIHKRIGRD